MIVSKVVSVPESDASEEGVNELSSLSTTKVVHAGLADRLVNHDLTSLVPYSLKI